MPARETTDDHPPPFGTAKRDIGWRGQLRVLPVIPEHIERSISDQAIDHARGIAGDKERAVLVERNPVRNILRQIDDGLDRARRAISFDPGAHDTGEQRDHHIKPRPVWAERYAIWEVRNLVGE